MKLKFFVIVGIFVNIHFLFAQTTGVISGNVKNKNTQENIIGCTIFIVGTTIATSTDELGNYKFTVPVGTYNVRAQFLGYQTLNKYNIAVSSGNYQMVNFEMEESTSQLNEVVVKYEKGISAVAADMITPLSVQQLTTEEIKSTPGGNFDVSRVVQTLPGVGGSSGPSRNDIIIRGGAPNENVYYLDGIEIPVLNHFQTQGSSGGAQGILNVSFIDELKLTSSAFDARYDNVLASTFVIKQRDGNPDRISGNVRSSLTESVVTLEGPVGKKTVFLASVRKSYLDLLFKAIDIPIRPNFYDFQYKITHNFNNKTTLTGLGLGAIDRFSFATTKKSSPENIFLVRSLPYINQWNYTVGFNLRRKFKGGYINFSLSRNVFNNAIDKFIASKKIESERTYGLQSQETENKFRIDVNKYTKGWKITSGISVQYVQYNTNLYSKLVGEKLDSNGQIIVPALELRVGSAIEFFKYGFFGQIAKNILNEKLLVSAGLRSDMNTFTATGNNPLQTLSPRISFAYHVTSKIDLTASVGTYYKIPTYTCLGYKDSINNLVNKAMKYISATHYVLGTQYLPNQSLRFTFEAFYKEYLNYPVSLITGVSLANLGSDFGSIGSEPVISNGKGKTAGFELYVQQKLTKKIFYVVSYTFVRSRFSGANGKLIASSWDARNLISATLGSKFKKGYEIGIKYRYAGGSPYTPYNMALSQSNYLLLGKGVLDYQLLNSLRLMSFNQLDFRIDKKINYRKASFDIYFDFQNALMFKNQSNPDYTFKRNEQNTDFATTDAGPLKSDGSNAIPVLLNNKSVTTVPTIGFIFEF